MCAGGGPTGWPVVVSEGYWRERYGGDPRILGTTVKIRGTIVTIVGVAPAAFHGVFPGVEPKFYLPLHFLPALVGGPRSISTRRASASRFATIARLKPGVSIEKPTAELAVHLPAPRQGLRADRPALAAGVRVVEADARLRPHGAADVLRRLSIRSRSI